MAAQHVRAEMVANVYSLQVRPGDTVEVGQQLLVLESMKMEIPVLAESPGTVLQVTVRTGEVVQEGDVLVILE